jgi:cytochrome oxidase Cu insertion factor (SCO1/SenC/PrrC family)
MQHTEVTRPRVSHDDGLQQEEYNFTHFRTKHLLSDLQATVDKRGIPPGAMAPDFELPRVNGAPLRLSDLRGRPTLLHFGSFT